MKSLKRIFVTVKSQIDHAVDHMENHEALANAAIRDLEKVGAKTSIHFRQLQNTSTRLKQQLEDLFSESDRWSERAVASREQDEQRALECVKRLRQTRVRITRTEKLLDESSRVEMQVKDDLDQVKERLQQLKKKKHLLAARHHRSDVMSALDKSQGFSGEDIQDVFDRWENSVLGSEFQYQDLPVEDAFVEEFERVEDEVELKSMLDELSQKAKNVEKGNKHGDAS